MLVLTVAAIFLFSSASASANGCGCYPSPFAIFKPIVEERLSDANEMWNCLTCSLPDDITSSQEAKVCQIQAYMDAANSHTSPLYVNGMLFNANKLMTELMDELDIDCMDALTFTYDLNDSVVSVEAGKMFYITLEENPSTGYEWELTASEGLEMHCDKYSAKYTDAMIVGAGGTHIWSFSASEPGTYVIKAVYMRPWMQQCLDDMTFELTIVVT